MAAHTGALVMLRPLSLLIYHMKGQIGGECLIEGLTRQQHSLGALTPVSEECPVVLRQSLPAYAAAPCACPLPLS